MAAPTPVNGSSDTAPLPAVVKRQYSFSSFSQNNPTSQQHGDRIDAEYDRTNAALNALIDICTTLKQHDVPQSAPQIAGADTADLEFDYALVSQAWAEYMPDTIPPNILAALNITGDHWSSRWWSNRAVQLIQNFSSSLPPGPPDTARYIYLATLGQTLFHGADRGGQTLAWDPANQQTTQVFRRGLLLTPTDDYNETTPNQITLNQPCAAGDIVQIFVNTRPAAFAPPANFTGSGSFTPPTSGNYALFVQAPGGATVTLGNGRIIGQLVTVKDALGSAGTTPITIAAAATIDNNPAYTLLSDFASLTLIWTGVMWGTL
jgi:hypothetical protein